MNSPSPWLKTHLIWKSSLASLKYEVPYDVFSTQKIDEGTELLLENLPEKKPERVLDMGCGYGALGLPLAAIWPEARVQLVDRDLLAVKFAIKNALLNQLSNVEAFGSLGFQNLSAQPPYDLIVCNMPARIGESFMEDFLRNARLRLNLEGEVRIVVIRDLEIVIETVCAKNAWAVRKNATGPRHSVYSLNAGDGKVSEPNPEKLYLRDQVEVHSVWLKRPFDLGGDDPKRLRDGLPVLFDVLPRQKSPQHFLCFRCAYGQMPISLALRYPEATGLSVDRDLLACEFTSLNVREHGLHSRIDVQARAVLWEADVSETKYDLVTGELSSAAGPAVAIAELNYLGQCLSEEGEGLVLCLEKNERDWLNQLQSQLGYRVQVALRRSGYSVIRISH